MTKSNKIRVGESLAIAWQAFLQGGRVGVAYCIIVTALRMLAGAGISDSFWEEGRLQATDWVILGGGLLVQSWLWFGLLRVALDTARGNTARMFRLATPLFDFLRALLVSSALLVVVVPTVLLWIIAAIVTATFPNLIAQVSLALIMTGSVVFIMYVTLAWSQAILLVLDGRARLFESLEESALLTKGVRGAIFLVYLAFGWLALPALVIMRFFPTPGVVESVGEWLAVAAVLITAEIWQVLVYCYGTFVAASIYRQLLARATLNESGPSSVDGD